MSQQSLDLRVYKNNQLIETKTSTHEVIKIGKLKSSHLCLNDEAVARMHAVIEVSGSDVRVIDLGSSTGTIVNGQPIQRNTALHSGDVLEFGSHRVEVEFRPVEGPRLPLDQQVAAIPPSPQIELDLSEVEVDDGQQVAEVVAMYKRTVLDVGHVGQTKSRRATALPLLGLGGLMILGGMGLFGYEASQPWEAYHAAKLEAAVSGATAPTKPGGGTGPLGFGLVLLGLVPFVSGGLRLREDLSEHYTIGEGHDATFHVPTTGLPDTAAFPLVRSTGGDFTLNFTSSMRGEVSLEGQRIDLQQLVASGRAAATAGAYAFPIPRGASARIKHQDITFHVNAVKPGAVVAGRGEVDWPFWSFVGGTGAVAMSMWMLLRAIPDDMLGIGFDEDPNDSRFARYMFQPDKEQLVETPPDEEVTESNEKAGGDGQRHDGAEGKMGDPTKKSPKGLYTMRGPADAIPQMARDFDPEMRARSAGILGVLSQQNGHFLASVHGGAFAVGNDQDDVWGGLTGTDVGAAYGTGGLGLIGTGRGGGGSGAGTIGLGNTGLIGKGGGGSKGSGYGRGKGAGFGSHGPRVPVVRQATAKVKGGGLDKSVIRRIVRSHINEVRGCYNKGLTRNPGLQGRVAVNFVITTTGKVSSSVVQETSLKDKNVSNCIAKAVKRWRFPTPRGGGNSIVTYPFTLRPG
jgi:TonB family protein